MTEMIGRSPGRSGGRGSVAVLALLVVTSLALPARAADLGVHNDGVGGTYEVDPCRACHNTASGVAALRGWALPVSPSGAGWQSKALSFLCYTCHDNTGGVLIEDAHDMRNNAFADASHSYVIDDSPREPDGADPGSLNAHPRDSGLPYMLTPSAEMECTSCHNVHVPTDRPFLHRSTMQTLCDECHAGRANNASDVSVPGSLRPYSTHPTRQPLGDTALANIKALADIDPGLKVPIPAAPAYAFGGHLYPSVPEDLMDCQTCHAVHGPAQGTPGLQSLLSLDNQTVAGTNDPSLLCEGCHYGGAAGQQVGSVVEQAGLPAGEWSDHPVDANGNRTFYPTGVALPALWLEATTPNRDRGAQPFYGAAAAAAPVCSSCHDVHGGIDGTPLLRGPQPSTVWTPLSYGDWCFACHTTAQVLPGAHHSVINSLSIAGGDAMDSQLGCGDCHGPAGTTTWTAHNGFWTWAVAIAPNDSAFCEACHTAADPTDLVAPALKGQTFTEPAAFPSSHGTVRGTTSHYLGADSGEFPGADPKVTAWSSGYFSSFGPPNAGGGGDTAPAAGAIICESCHNILFNDGRANPADYPSQTLLRAGWESNLLLEPYEDDPPGAGSGTGANGVGSALCTGCHTASGNHHPLTGDVVPMSGLTLKTGAGSFADQPGAPNALSYPNVDATDCDSCHRPHGADNDSDVAAAPHGAGTSADGQPTRHILEIDGPGHRYAPDLCAECHNR